MKDAIIIGNGMVGKATAHALGISDFVSRHEKRMERGHVSDYHYVFLCLPTPTINGKQDVSLIEQYIKYVAKEKKDNVFIIRSTVLPGTCEELLEKYNVKIVHVPEFLTEATWVKDSEWPELVVIGGDDGKAREEIIGLFKARYKGAEFVITDHKTAELIKYARNTFYALKVVFANEIFDYAKKIDVNYEEVKRAMYASSWIGKNHLDIWHKGGRGAGGKCLYKDLDAFAHAIESALFMVANDLNKQLVTQFPKTE